MNEIQLPHIRLCAAPKVYFAVNWSERRTFNPVDVIGASTGLSPRLSMKANAPLTATKPGRLRQLPRRIKRRAPSGVFARLTAEQQAALLTWLDVENVTYAAACDRIQNQFGVAIPIHMVFRFYRKTLAARLATSAATGDGSPIPLQLVVRCNRPVEIELKTEALQP